MGKELRDRIVARAKELGYRPNPQVAIHMREMKRSHRFPRLSTIALITFAVAEDGLLRRYVAGSRERAESLGYHFDEINFFRDVRGRSHRLEQILVARGIQGVVLTPAPRQPMDFELDWSRFSGSIIGATHHQIRYGRILHDSLAAIREIIEQGANLGYRSFGLIDTLAQEERIGYLRRAGFLLEQNLAGERKAGFKFKILPPAIDGIVRWARNNERVLLIPNTVDEAKSVTDAGLDVPHEIGIAMAHKGRRMRQYAGILQQAEFMGACAVDLVTEALTSYHPGFFEIPKEIIVPGIWTDGPSMEMQDSHPPAPLSS